MIPSKYNNIISFYVSFSSMPIPCAMTISPPTYLQQLSDWNDWSVLCVRVLASFMCMQNSSHHTKLPATAIKYFLLSCRYTIRSAETWRNRNAKKKKSSCESTISLFRFLFYFSLLSLNLFSACKIPLQRTSSCL